MNKSRVTTGLLSINHVINDTYSNFLPQLLPFLVAATGLSITKATSLVSAFTVSSAVMQPIFGYLADRKKQNLWIYIGTLWMAASLSLTGICKNYTLLILLAAAAGVGTAAFHPQAYSIVSGDFSQRRGFAVSTFMGVGHLGWAAAPLLFIPLFEAYGTKASVYIIFPSVILALALIIFLRPNSASSKKAIEPGQGSLKEIIAELKFLLLIAGLWSLVYTGLISLLPIYLKSNTEYAGITGFLLFGFFIAGAFGGIIGGHLSDKLGRRTLIIYSSVLATPLLFGFLLFDGLTGYAFLILGSLSLMAVFPVILVLAHELVPDNKAMTSGVCNGLGIGIGALAAILVGKIADISGLITALGILFFIPLIAGTLSLKIKTPETRTQAS